MFYRAAGRSRDDEADNLQHVHVFVVPSGERVFPCLLTNCSLNTPMIFAFRSMSKVAVSPRVDRGGVGPPTCTPGKGLYVLEIDFRHSLATR